eukprot:scaffold21468_cov41-Phaeocystis_antarctica.AAC.1
MAATGTPRLGLGLIKVRVRARVRARVRVRVRARVERQLSMEQASAFPSYHALCYLVITPRATALDGA